MFYALTWFGVSALLALWSLAAWAIHAVAAWTVSNSGILAGGAASSEGLRVPDWLAPRVPPEFGPALDSLASAITPAIEAALGWAPTLAGGLSVAVWVVWGVGSVILIVLGLVVTGLIAMLRRRVAVPATPSGSAASAC